MKKGYTTFSVHHRDDLINQFGADQVWTDAAICDAYGKDQTEDLVFPPSVVLKPKDTQEVSWIMKYAYEHNLPVVPVGGRTGLSGGVLNVCSGIALSLERMNQILHIDVENFQVRTQPGVITQVLQERVAEAGLFYPVDPASQGSCFIGGNVAENAGGARAVKYGVTQNYVLNLEVVLANGEIIKTGADTLKNATGYNLTQLMVGSEGTLGIVTEIVLRLLPPSPYNVLLWVPFYQLEEAVQAVSGIFRAGITPSAMEFMERPAIEQASVLAGVQSVVIDEGIAAVLMIELDGNHLDVLEKEAEMVTDVLESFDVGDILFADTADQKEVFWRLRRCVSEAVRNYSIFKEEDTVVPRFALPQLLIGVKEIGSKYGFKTICYGHAGDGNLHINILKEGLSDSEWHEMIPIAIAELFDLTIALGGTLSGEHGIGWVQKDYMPQAFSNLELSLMQQIKEVFDPKGILNPLKIFPEG